MDVELKAVCIVGGAVCIATVTELMRWSLQRYREKKEAKKEKMKKWFKGGREYKKNTALFNI